MPLPSRAAPSNGQEAAEQDDEIPATLRRFYAPNFALHAHDAQATATPMTLMLPPNPQAFADLPVAGKLRFLHAGTTAPEILRHDTEQTVPLGIPQGNIVSDSDTSERERLRHT